MAYGRLRGDQEHKKGRKSSKSRQKSNLTTPNMMGAISDAKGASQHQSSMLDISGLSSFNPEGCAMGMGGGIQPRMSVGAPSDLGQSLMPYLSVEMKASESQCDLWSVADMLQKEERVRELS